jgi:hypothetical protein
MSDTENLAEYTLPSNPADRKKIKEAIYEINGAMTEIKDKRSFINDVKKNLKEEFKINPKTVTKMAKAVAGNFKEMVAEEEEWTAAYELLFESNNTSE